MANKFYSTDDFIHDEYFQQWVFTSDESINEYWEHFLLQHPEQQGQAEEARAFLQAIKFETIAPEDVIGTIKSNFNAAIDALQASNTAAQLQRSGKTQKWFYLVAASVAFTLFLSYIFLSRDHAYDILHALRSVEQKAPRGQQRHIVLDDGTNVWLNANSTLRYGRNFSEAAAREVVLVGEAYFDVAEDAKKPFIVHASGITINVLGTAFNVRSYPDDQIVETTLVRGKVNIAVEKSELPDVALFPSQQAVFSRNSKKIELKETVNTDYLTAWKNGWMIFNDKPFSYIRETLERWYDVKIILTDENSLSCSFSGKFHNKTLEEVLEIFSNTEAIRYRIDGNRVFISGTLCKHEELNSGIP